MIDTSLSSVRVLGHGDDELGPASHTVIDGVFVNPDERVIAGEILGR